MSTLWRYLSFQFLRAFLGSLAILALVLLVVDMLLNLSEILEATDSALSALNFLFIRVIAQYLPYLIPAAAFTGAFVCVGQAARANEVVALKAGGVSPLRALFPVFALSIAIAAVAFLLNETVSVRAAAALTAGMKGEASDISLRSGTIWYHTGPFIYNIREPDSEDGTVRDIRVFERDDAGRLIRLIHGTSATQLQPHQWRFEGVTIRTFDPAFATVVPQVEEADEMVIMLRGDRSPRLLETELASLPAWQLSRHVGQVLEEGGNPGKARSVLHSRLTVPLLSILFVVLALPLGLAVEQTRSLAMPALQGVALLFALLLTREYGARFSTHEASAAAAYVPWTILALFFAYGAWRLRRVPQ